MHYLPWFIYLTIKGKMEKNKLNSMFENLLHIGNKTNFWNAKMKPYIYGSVNGIHVINLVKTSEKLDEVKKELEKLTSEGKKVLFVWTKLQAKSSIKKLAVDTWNYYVTEKWVPGLLTNFKTIKRRIVSYIKLLKDADRWAFDVLTKKEKASKMLELEKLDKAYSWVKEMKKLPEIIFVVDGIYEEQAIKEANNLKIPVFAIFNTNGDDTIVSNFVPANTNSVKSIDYLISEITPSIKKAKAPSTKAKVNKFTEKKEATKKAPVKKETPKKEAPKKEEKVEVKKEEVKKAPAKKTTTKKEEK